jgi:hypothetical protein
MQNWQVALLVITAVFVGMWIPVSLQLFTTLRSGQRFLESMGSRGEQTLAEVSTSVVALNQVIADVGEVARAAAQIKDSIRVMSSIGAAVGPAVIALVRALREPGEETEDEPAGGNGTSLGAPAVASPSSGASLAKERPAPAQKESTP